MIHKPADNVLDRRRAGVLLHPTALPGQYGVLGRSAREFMDFMQHAGLTLWQTLPLGPTHPDLSPYQSLSAHAGNPALIDLKELTGCGLLEDGELDQISRQELLGSAAERFFAGKATGDRLTRNGFSSFRDRNRYWLEDFCLFGAIRETLERDHWLSWPEPLRDRHPAALQHMAARHQTRINRIAFEQYLFHDQWQALREYGKARGILLFGDIPIFVAHDSADVWANRELFKLDGEGRPTVVAGVPPDYFSDRGQHWGNPLYEWAVMEKDGYQWWLDRLASQQRLFDLVRLDHFRGLQAFWEIPADQPEPVNGHWVPGPGAAFLEACFQRFPDLKLVAENLGVIGPDEEKLRKDFGLPGMVVLQFAFDGSPDNPHLPGNHHPEDLVYTGTHDNDTTSGWYQALDGATRQCVNRELGTNGDDMPWPVIAAAFRSPCAVAIAPMQDYLALGSEARFNTPGTIKDNWLWRMSRGQCTAELAGRVRELAVQSDRLCE
jgi:4-alpha-glucanotransferase